MSHPTFPISQNLILFCRSTPYFTSSTTGAFATRSVTSATLPPPHPGCPTPFLPPPYPHPARELSNAGGILAFVPRHNRTAHPQSSPLHHTNSSRPLFSAQGGTPSFRPLFSAKGGECTPLFFVAQSVTPPLSSLVMFVSRSLSRSANPQASFLAKFGELREPRQVAALTALLKPLLLRRTKRDVERRWQIQKSKKNMIRTKKNAPSTSTRISGSRPLS